MDDRVDAEDRDPSRLPNTVSSSVEADTGAEAPRTSVSLRAPTVGRAGHMPTLEAFTPATPGPHMLSATCTSQQQRSAMDVPREPMPGRAEDDRTIRPPDQPRNQAEVDRLPQAPMKSGHP